MRQCSKTTGCTVCQPGWTGINCATDVNECTAGTSECTPGATCVNVPGTYLCICGDGSGDEDCYGQ